MRSIGAPEAANLMLPWSYFKKLLLFFFYVLAAANIVSLQGRVRGSCVPTPEEASILMGFKDAVLDLSHHLSSWQENNLSCSQIINSSSSSNCSAWSGVNCGRLHGRVTELLLSNMSLQGPIPGSSLAQLRFLRTLNLSSNNFFGSLSPQIANCTRLETLDLSQNTLNGSIPSEWGTLRNLQVLALEQNALTDCSALTLISLDTNELTGSIPPELGLLSRLEWLSLSQNQVTGNVPATLANCSALEDLFVQLNGLSDIVPPELGMLNKLQILFLWGNALTGDIPATLGNCTALTMLSLDVNQLSNNIPQELGMLNQLWYLALSENNLTGDVPPTLANCSALQHVDLGTNLLSGNIPSQLVTLNNMSWFSISLNTLTGNVPATALANWTALQYLDLGSNRFTGTLQFLTQLHNPTGLYALGLAGNNFQGQLPDVFDRFSSLQQLVLVHNSLSGALPRSLQSLKALTHLWLQRNLFQGSIPYAFLTSLQLQELDLSSNNLSGSIPDSLGSLSGLLDVNLSHNFLSGPIPPKLGSLLQLQNLTLSNNNLSGDIPSGLSDCVQLISLNLASNQLSGTIPTSLGKIKNLTLLDLSYNEFTGLVPNITPFNNTSVTKLTGNIGLCGQIVNRICDTNPPNDSTSNKHSNRKATVGVTVAVIVAVMLMVVTAFCYCSKRNNKNQASQQLRMCLAGMQLLNVTAGELREATGGFSEENVLGRGGVGTVYRAILAGGKAVAVKLLKNDMALADEATFRREVEILAKVRHRNVLRVWGCCFNLDMKAIILELMPNGSLDKYLDGMLAEISGGQMLKILYGVAQGLEYLHHRHPEGSIVHCDIKPENILLDADLEAHIADFGIAKVLKGSTFQESASILLRGSVGYIAPEYGYKPRPSIKGDVYSFGVVMLEVLTGKRVTCNEILDGGGHTFLSWVRSAYPHNVLTILNTLSLPPNVALQLFEVALSCTQDSPINRPTMTDICRIFMDLHNTTIS